MPQTTEPAHWEDLALTDLWQLDFQTLEVAESVWYAKQDVGATLDDLRQWALDHRRGPD